jgi:hypothetical protein
MASERGTSIRCTWCRFYYPARPTSGTCNNCGGPLPPPSGLERGASPPPAPRTLPSAYRKSVLVGRNVFSILGIVFSSIGALMLVVAVVVGATAGHSRGAPIAALVNGILTLVWAGIGVPMLLVGLGRGKRKLAALVDGAAVEGEITGVTVNRSVRINGRSPWVIAYGFPAASGPATGRAESFEPHEGEREAGDKVWVVYLPSDPSVSTIWPPVA